MSDRGSPAPGRVTRAALAPTSKPVDYRQTHVVNGMSWTSRLEERSADHYTFAFVYTLAPSTFTQAPQKTYMPNVPSRLRPPAQSQSSYGSPAPSYHPSQYASQAAPPQTYQASISYPAGVYPLAAIPPGAMSRGIHSSRPLSQARHTTYESRMKTGVTTLVQPLNITGGPNAAFAQAYMANVGNSTPVASDGRRRTHRVNYAEDDAYEGIDDDDGGDGGGTRYSRRMAQQSRRDTSSSATDAQSGWSWLGDRTPAERVSSTQATPMVWPFV